MPHPWGTQGILQHSSRKPLRHNFNATSSQPGLAKKGWLYDCRNPLKTDSKEINTQICNIPLVFSYHSIHSPNNHFFATTVENMRVVVTCAIQSKSNLFQFLCMVFLFVDSVNWIRTWATRAHMILIWTELQYEISFIPDVYILEKQGCQFYIKILNG